MQGWQIRVTGVVQGVGFRPFVYHLAKTLGLTGTVINDQQGVLVTLNAKPQQLSEFITALQRNPPTLADIQSITVNQQSTHDVGYQDFQILATHPIIEPSQPATFLPIDAHICQACLKELHSPQDRRFGYPFINCTACGPRFSIIRQLPYDRVNTSMADFAMCPDCDSEYHDPNSRRYHAQPIACPACGPKLSWIDTSDPSQITTDSALKRCKAALRQGKIVAIKSVGGFHLTVDATNEQAVQRLRERKNRPSKPLAILLKNLATVRQIAHVSPTQAQHLTATGRPIVLLPKRGKMTFESYEGQSAELAADVMVKPTSQSIAQAVAPHQASIGVMLPSAPLHELLLDDGLTALVMTSGNVAGDAIEFCNTQATKRLASVADGWLLNDRDIVMRVDDSVVRCVARVGLDPLAVWLRKGRGYAPYPVMLDFLPLRSDLAIVAYGSQLKNTVGFLQGSQAYISQHIGDLDSAANVASQHHVLRHLMGLYAVQQSVVAVDAHPEFGKNIANFSPTFQVNCANKANVIRVQHHHAHMASCMADNRLTGQTLGVIFDGLGFGSCDDTGKVKPNSAEGALWGGEFLLGDYCSVRRVAHLAALPLIGGDKAVYEPIRTAFGLMYEAQLADYIDDIPSLSQLTSTERTIFTQMLDKRLNTFATTSMGRLFDGVSALLGLCSYSQYEAQAPMILEDALFDNREFDNTEFDDSQFRQFDTIQSEHTAFANESSPWVWSLVDGYEFALVHQNTQASYVPLVLDYRPVIRAMVADIIKQQSVALISHKFHSAVVRAVGRVCQAIQAQVGVQQVVLSGGVFSNGFLLSNTLQHLQQLGFAVYAHQQVPTGDGGIALGQLAVASQQSP